MTIETRHEMRDGMSEKPRGKERGSNTEKQKECTRKFTTHTEWWCGKVCVLVPFDLLSKHFYT